MNPSQPSPTPSLLAVAGLVIACLSLSCRPADRDARHAAQSAPALRRMSSPNMERYVGSSVCRQCHAAQGDCWVHSAHSLALAEVDLNLEPPDAGFTHTASGRSYRVLRRDGALWHQEWLPTSEGLQLLAEHRMRAAIGSGRFSKSYLWTDGDFWMESPATWYAARQEWGISPGYDTFNHGFERPIDIRCIRCHAGQVETLDGSVHRLSVKVAAVDCERCHGPGERHVAARERQPEGELLDEQIVHPAKLSRELQIDICAQCHLHGDAAVELASDLAAQFRPGMPLSQFQVHFALDWGNREMSVVGHVEQMQLSRCYTESKTLTCTTCHEPHGRLPDAEPIDFRASCLTCHSDQSCAVSPADRRRQQPGDDCTACHMPRVSTDIPHFAFRHHRIGRHAERAEPASEQQPSSPGRLLPLDDLSHLTAAERERAFGLAAVQLLTHPSAREHGAAYALLAQQHLERALAAGAGDAEVHAALARLLWESHPARAQSFAQQVLQSAEASAEARGAAFFALARMAGQHDVASAIPHWEQLVKIRRYADAWHALGRGYHQAGRLTDAVSAAKKAVEISPERPDFRRTLAALLSATGDHEAATQHRVWAERLERRR